MSIRYFPILLNRCLEHLREGNILVIWKSDRLRRTTKELIQIADGLQEKNIGLHIVTQEIDTTTPADRMFFWMGNRKLDSSSM